MGCDSNSHHTVWGCRDVNARGETLLAFLSSSTLEFLNKGAIPTFTTARGQSVIDLSLSTHSLSRHIKEWKVSMEASMSDHRHILFKLDCPEQETTLEFRNPRNTDWNLFREELGSRLFGVDRN